MFDLEAAEKLLRNVVIVLVVLIIGVGAVLALNSGGLVDLSVIGIGGSTGANSDDPALSASSGSTVQPVKTESGNSKSTSASNTLNSDIPEPPPGVPPEVWYRQMAAQQPQQSIADDETTTSNSTVSAAAPILPEDPYASDLHARDQPEEEPEQELIEIFSDSFSFEFDNAVAYTVDVAKGPLEIRYTAHAHKETSYDSWMEITVRDADSNEIVAQDGFRRTYSSETEQQITVRDEGCFHITIQGRSVDADIAFLTGG